MYCEECLENWFKFVKNVKKICFICWCDVIFFNIVLVLVFIVFIEGFFVKCENVVNGCKMVLKFGDLEKYLEKCVFILVECSGCDEIFS